ncbi:MAG TPA: TetR family transcriptional regulator [Galbitalea sp.]
MARPKEFDRDEAVDCALTAFRKGGFSSTSTDDLRLAMGIGRQSLYDTFKGKKELYLEALRRYLASRVHGHFDLFRKAKSPLQAIEDLLLSIALENPKERRLACLAVSSICEFGTADADVASINREFASTMQAALEKLVTEAKAKHLVRASLNAEDTARYLVSTLAGMRVIAITGASPEALRSIAAIAILGLQPH